jgi:hypothetical protein
MTQKTHDSRPFECTFLDHHIQFPIRRNRTDSRQMIVGQGYTQNGCLASGGIGPYARGQQIKPRCIDKEYNAPFWLSDFSNSSHFSARQRSMASFRWLAWDAGFCPLQPIFVKSCPTWAGSYATQMIRLISTVMRGRVHTTPRTLMYSAPWPRCSRNSTDCTSNKRGLGDPSSATTQRFGSSLFSAAQPLSDSAGRHAKGSIFLCQPFCLSSHVHIRHSSYPTFGRWFVLSSIAPSVPCFAL